MGCGIPQKISVVEFRPIIEKTAMLTERDLIESLSAWSSQFVFHSKIGTSRRPHVVIESERRGTTKDLCFVQWRRP